MVSSKNLIYSHNCPVRSHNIISKIQNTRQCYNSSMNIRLFQNMREYDIIPSIILLIVHVNIWLYVANWPFPFQASHYYVTTQFYLHNFNETHLRRKSNVPTGNDKYASWITHGNIANRNRNVINSWSESHVRVHWLVFTLTGWESDVNSWPSLGIMTYKFSWLWVESVF